MTFPEPSGDAGSDAPGRQELDLAAYIGRELQSGRSLFDVLGDPDVRTESQDDPLLLDRVARDERVLAALSRERAGGAEEPEPFPDAGRVLPKRGGGVAR
jgi:hypothetical protein